MHKLTLIVVLLFGALPPARAVAPDTTAGKDAAELLRQGLFEEEANRDSGKAATAYAGVVALYDSQRALAATALFRLAEVRVAQGNKTEATALYQRLLAEFANQETLAKLTRERLAALGAPPPAASPAGNTAETLTAEEANELARVRDLVRNSPDLLNAVATEGEPLAGHTPLTWAAQHGWEHVAALLLEHGAKPNGIDDGGEPLKIAVAGGHKHLAEILLAHGAGLDAATPDGWTALHAACYFRRNEIVRFLVEKGANPNVVFTLRSDRKDTVQRGWGPETKTDADRSNSGSEAGTPLLITIANGDDALLSLLLAHGADPNLYASLRPEVDKNPTTPLIDALYRGAESMAKLLIQHGAKVDFVSPGGDTALGAAASDTPAMVPLLLDREKLRMKNSNGCTPLWMSIVVGGRQRWTAGVLEPRPKFEARFAVYRAAWEAMLAQGADINATDSHGQTPLFRCLPDDNYPKEVATWLLAHGADINARDEHKNTPLHQYCALHRAGLNDEQKATLRWLLDFGADVDARDAWNKTAFDVFDSREPQREFYYPRVAPKLNQEPAVTAFFSLKNSSPSRSLRVAPEADFDAPPTLVGLMLRMVGQNRDYSLPLNDLTISIYRASNPVASSFALHFGAEPVDASKWPTLRWGDVVVFASDGSIGPDCTKWLYSLPATLKRTVSVQLGDRTATLTLAEPPLPDSYVMSPAALRPRPILHFPVYQYTLKTERWAPTITPLPAWTLSELATRLTGAEPRARLEAVQVERTTDGTAHVWTVDLRTAHLTEGKADPEQPTATGKPPSARLADGDRLIIPLLPAADPAALAARRKTINLAAADRLFAETVFTRFEDDENPHTLAEFLMQAYIQPLLVPNPDLSRIVIHRLSGSGAEEEHIPVDFAGSVHSVSPDAAPEELRRHDLSLQWGDVVEVSPLDGVLPTQWGGFDAPVRSFLDRVLSRTVGGTFNGIPLLNLRTGGVGEEAMSLLKPKFYSCNMSQPGPGVAPAFGGDNLSWKYVSEDTAPLTVQALLQSLGVNPDNLVRCVIHEGGRTREYDAAKLRACNRWLSLGATVDIQQFTP